MGGKMTEIFHLEDNECFGIYLSLCYGESGDTFLETSQNFTLKYHNSSKVLNQRTCKEYGLNCKGLQIISFMRQSLSAYPLRFIDFVVNIA